MSDGSLIEWLQRPGTKPATWNPIRAYSKETGKRGWFCVHRHEGCRWCYSEDQNMRAGMSGGNGYAYIAQNLDKVRIELHEPTLLQPLHWREPRTIFVCSMTDLYGEWVPFEWIDKIKAVERLCRRHTFIELTKRPERMREYNTALVDELRDEEGSRIEAFARAYFDIKGKADVDDDNLTFGGFPLPNVEGLVSCSEQKDADAYIPDLLATPLAVRGVSLEPLLGPIDLTRVDDGMKDGTHCIIDALSGLVSADDETVTGVFGQPDPKLDWVITGGESGKHARPMHPGWVRSIRDQCAEYGVKYFHKQNGEFVSVSEVEGRGEHFSFPDGATVRRTGWRKAGRTIDGRTHDEFPGADA